MRRLLSNLGRRIRRPGTGERRFRIIVATSALVMVLLTSPAWADPGLSWMGSTFDIKDSNGIKLSQYELSMDNGGVTHPIRSVWFSIIQLVWTGHLGLVGLMGALLDWTVSLTWVPWLAGPVADIQKLIHDQVLAPVGATAWGGGILVLLMLIAGSLAAIRILRGRTSGWWDIVRAAVVSALAVGFFAAPVTNIVGDGSHLAEPLAASQQIGTAMSQMITSGGKPSATVGETQAIKVDDKGHPVFTTGQTTKVSSMLVDSFVRPLHQQLNYGQIIDKTKCEKTYNDALKAGPHGDDAKDQRDAMKGCDSKYGDYTDTAAASSWLVGFSYYEVGMIFMVVLLVLFTLATWYYIGKLLWSALISMIDVLKAIPGHTEPLLRDMVSIAHALIFYVTSLTVLSGILKVIGMVFGSGGNLTVKFLVVDLIAIIGVVVLIMHLINHHRGEARMRDRLKNLLRAKDRAPSVIAAAARRAASMAGRGVKNAALRRTLGRGPTPTMTRPTTPEMARQVGRATDDGQPTRAADHQETPATRHSTARRLASTAATAMTGGAGAVARKAIGLAGAYRTMRSGGGITPGHARSTNAALAVTARAHNYLADKKNAAATIAHQAHTGAPIRSTTGSKRLDAAARSAGILKVAADTAGLKTKVKAAKVSAPLTQAGRRMVRPVAATGTAARRAVSSATGKVHTETRETRKWAQAVTAPLTALTAPPTRIGPQPPPKPEPASPQLPPRKPRRPKPKPLPAEGTRR